MAWNPTPISVMNDELRKRLAKGPMNGVDSLGIPDSVRNDYYSLDPARRQRVLQQFDEMKRNPGMPWRDPIGGSGPLSKAELDQLTPDKIAEAIVKPPAPAPAQASASIIPPPDVVEATKAVGTKTAIPLPVPGSDAEVDAVAAAAGSEPIIGQENFGASVSNASTAAPAVSQAATGAAADFSKGAFGAAAKGMDVANSFLKSTGSANPAGIAKAAAEGAAGGPGGMMASLGLILLGQLLGKKQGPPAPAPVQQAEMSDIWNPPPRTGISWVG